MIRYAIKSKLGYLQSGNMIYEDLGDNPLFFLTKVAAKRNMKMYRDNHILKQKEWIVRIEIKDLGRVK